MKTKVAEALMYGKRIIGTREAFSGYEFNAEEVGWLCNTKEEFVAALRRVEGELSPFSTHPLETYTSAATLTTQPCLASPLC